MKPRLREALVVEGRYDVNSLRQVVDGVILETRGFRIFRDRERKELLRFYAETRGLVILTDSDGAGFLIRGHLKGKKRKALAIRLGFPERVTADALLDAVNTMLLSGRLEKSFFDAYRADDADQQDR